MTAVPYPFEIRSTQRYTSLEEARRAAIHPIATAVAQAIREGIDCGRLVVVDGTVLPARSLDIHHQDGV